jgi:predicted Zn-ribbon and HTH transcriptional regulator
MKHSDPKAIGQVLLPGCRCRCGHEWLPRQSEEKPRVCPKCKSANWDRPKLFERTAGGRRAGRNGRTGAAKTDSRG